MTDSEAGSSKSDSEARHEKARDAEIVELHRATTAFEHAALRPLPLLNGGAIVAALTFAGHSRDHIDISQIKCALLLWSVGLSSAVLALFGGYFSQYSFWKARVRQREVDRAIDLGNVANAGCEECRQKFWAWTGRASRWAVYALALIALGGFMAGAVASINALKP